MLNLLAGRAKKKEPFTLEGEVLVNGVQIKKKIFQHISAYVMQVGRLASRWWPYGARARSGRRDDAQPDG